MALHVMEGKHDSECSSDSATIVSFTLTPEMLGQGTSNFSLSALEGEKSSASMCENEGNTNNMSDENLVVVVEEVEEVVMEVKKVGEVEMGGQTMEVSKNEEEKKAEVEKVESVAIKQDQVEEDVKQMEVCNTTMSFEASDTNDTWPLCIEESSSSLKSNEDSDSQVPSNGNVTMFYAFFIGC